MDIRGLPDGAERHEWWARSVAAYPPYADYQAKTERRIPVFVATRRRCTAFRRVGRGVMDRGLRTSAAHVLVADVDEPQPAAEAMRHLLRVLRLRDGEAVTVTDGAGRWRTCAVTGASIVPTGKVHVVDRPEPPRTVAVAPPKGERLEWLVGKCTEVGVDRIVLLDADRSVVRWKGERADKQLERLRRIAVEASMQSRRVWLPELVGPVHAVDILRSAAVAEPGGDPVTSDVDTIAVGPEGGWSPAELAAAGRTVSLGDQILRVETAAVAAAVLMVDQSRRLRSGPHTGAHP
jgi:16S rRNA (uracil1498-N3)-methyltransferase